MERKGDPVLEFLESVKFAALEQSRCLQKVIELDAQCQDITAKLSGMPVGGSGDRHRDALWASLADQREMYWKRYIETSQKKAAVEEFLGGLKNPAHRTVLGLHYVDLLKWPEVYKELQKNGMYYSERQIFRLRDEALAAAREMWEHTNPVERSLGNEDCNSETQNI